MNTYLPKIIGGTINFTSYFSSRFAAKLAIDLFSMPKKGKIQPEESEYLNSATQCQVLCDIRSIKTYNWKGDKETILLAHGWESNSFRWMDLIESLRPLNYNIIALDAPAHGASSGKLFNALLYAECIKMVVEKFNVHTIVGHSVGGMASVFFQHKYQIKSIEKLVLLGAPADFIGVFSRYENMMGYNKRVSKALENEVLKKYNHLPEYFAPANFSKEIQAKGLIIHDKKDRIIPYEDAQLFANRFKNSELITTKGFGHSLIDESLTPKIIEYINS